jgi:hypothetical protein
MLSRFNLIKNKIPVKSITNRCGYVPVQCRTLASDLNRHVNLTNQSEQHKKILPQDLSITEKTIGTLANVLCSPLHLLGYGFIMVQPNWVKVSTYFGKYTGVHYKEGTSWRFNVMGQSLYDVYVGHQSIKLENSKIIDKNGNPIVVSCIMNYNITNPEQYILGISDGGSFIVNQGDSVVKSVISQYSYDELRSNNTNFNMELAEKANNMLSVAGVNVSSFMITDMNYAKEIATAMLVKQQASAYIIARTEIADAATSIIDNIIKYYGSVLTKEDQADLIKKLLVVITSGSSVQPTMSVSDSSSKL